MAGRPAVLPVGPPRSRGVSLYFAIAFLSLCALVLVVPAMPRADLILDAAMTVAMIGILVLFVASRLRAGRLDYFEVIIPLSVIYVFYFGWSTIYLKLSPDALTYLSLMPWLTPALALALLGYVCLMLGYATFGRHSRPAGRKRWIPTRLSFCFIVGLLGFFGQTFHYFQEKQIIMRSEVSVVFSLGQQFAPLFFFAWFVVWYLIWAGKLRRPQVYALLVFYTPLILGVLFLLVGGKKRAIMLLGIPAVAFWYARGRLPIKAILVVLLIAVFVIFPIYNTYRLQDERAATVGRLEETFQDATQWNSDVYLDRSVGAFLKRMGIITSVAAVLRDVGTYVDYKRGETLFLVPLATLIPRVFWPDKPVIGLGREFGVTFQLIAAVDSRTRIAPSLVGELYWNFDLPGVVVGMFVFGMLIRWVYRFFGEVGGFDPIGKGIYLMLLERMLHFESNAAMMVNIMIRSVTVLVIVLFILKKVGIVGTLEEGPVEPNPHEDGSGGRADVLDVSVG